MKKLLLLTSLLMFSILSFASVTETSSIYTDLKSDCTQESKSNEYAEIDFSSSVCKAFGGYELKIEGGDARYAPTLSYGGKKLNLIAPTVFHDISSDAKIEWVYDKKFEEDGGGKINFKAMIYRLNVDEGSDSKIASKLYVVKLNGTKTCTVGITTSNTKARRIANDAKATCLK